MPNNYSPTPKINNVLKKKNKFANMTPKDWQEANEQSKMTHGISRLTYEDIFGDQE